MLEVVLILATYTSLVFSLGILAGLALEKLLRK